MVTSGDFFQETSLSYPLSMYFSLSSGVLIQTYALFTIGAMGLSNTAMMHLNDSTHTMFKRCNLIRIMIDSILILCVDEIQLLSVL